MTSNKTIENAIRKYNLGILSISPQEGNNFLEIAMANTSSGIRNGRTKNNRVYIVKKSQIQKHKMVAHAKIDRISLEELNKILFEKAKDKKKIAKRACNRKKICYTYEIENGILDLEL